MTGELYQLIAIDKEGNQKVIELNNDNKNNKGFLFFIDSGTAYMESQQALIDYLMKQGKLTNPDVTFVIKYNNRGERYLPVIYNDPELRYIALNAKNEKNLKYYIGYLLNRIDPEICNSNFYSYIRELNSDIFSEISNGNYLDSFALNELRKFYETFGVAREEFFTKEQRKDDLVKRFDDYKKIRTLYIFYKHYMNTKSNNLDKNSEYEIPKCVKYILPGETKESNPEIPQELKKAYEHYGMDGVYALVDSDEVIQNGYKFK